MTSQETIIDLIRHGEPVGGNRLRGTQDDPLSEQGWQQMWQSVGECRDWSSVVTSPLQRCRHFADSLAEKLDVEAQINDGFREIGFGIWEGKTTRELMADDPGALQRYWKDPNAHAPSGAEKLSDFTARVHGAWEQLIDTQARSHTLLVCHGGVIRAILVKVLGMPVERIWSFDVPYANVTRIVYHSFDDGSRAPQLRFHQAAIHV